MCLSEEQRDRDGDRQREPVFVQRETATSHYKKLVVTGNNSVRQMTMSQHVPITIHITNYPSI